MVLSLRGMPLAGLMRRSPRPLFLSLRAVGIRRRAYPAESSKELLGFGEGFTQLRARKSCWDSAKEVAAAGWKGERRSCWPTAEALTGDDGRCPEPNNVDLVSRHRD